MSSTVNLTARTGYIYDYTVSVRAIPEFIVDRKRLNRHVRHDSRSRGYRYLGSGAPLKTNIVKRYIPILNQGQIGDCTCNAMVGACGCGSVYNALSSVQVSSLTETTCIDWYSQEEQILYGAPYPPTDQGGDGLTIAGVAKTNGYISAYTHCFALQDVLQAISDGHAVCIGSNWYSSFDNPAGSDALVSITPTASVRGGHEYLARGINVDQKLILLDNSWGNGWGDAGSFIYSWDTLDQLLSEQGDGTVPLALGTPAPAPAPVAAS